MAKHRLILLLFSLATFYLFSCKNDDTDNNPQTAYDKGVLIINEGPFQNGSGSIMHFDRDTRNLTDDIFAVANKGAKIGNILQSAAYWNGKTYLMVNNANRIYVVNPQTFAFVDSVKGITQPRYFQGISAEKAAVSSWTKGVSFINLATNTLGSSVATGNGADKMLLDANTLWVLNSGGFGKDSTITLVDVLTEKVIKTVKTAPGPNSIVKAGSSIWVLCGSYWDQSGTGTLLEYRFEQVAAAYKVPKYASNLMLSNDGKDLFFLAGNTVYRKSALVSAKEPEAFINRTFASPYALDQDPLTGKLLMADAGDFSSGSKVFFINPDTKLVSDSLRTGIGTNSFLFGN